MTRYPIRNRRGREARRLAALVAWLILIAALFLAAALDDVTFGAEPRSTPVAAEADGPELCLGPGWAPGDQYGPGASDIVPDLPPCEPDPDCPELLPGWHLGDRWGPGPDDVITCDFAREPTARAMLAAALPAWALPAESGISSDGRPLWEFAGRGRPPTDVPVSPVKVIVLPATDTAP